MVGSGRENADGQALNSKTAATIKPGQFLMRADMPAFSHKPDTDKTRNCTSAGAVKSFDEEQELQARHPEHDCDALVQGGGLMGGPPVQFRWWCASGLARGWKLKAVADSRSDRN
jgi:hypothetical protein